MKSQRIRNEGRFKARGFCDSDRESQKYRVRGRGGGVDGDIHSIGRERVRVQTLHTGRDQRLGKIIKQAARDTGKFFCQEPETSDKVLTDE
ncbi:unnamed protein product [Dovyalis caffra]|uniref:Uncharacterized protein n=1 Tax=Dovyalis caffra TaxID=77055 RepID=A0AAV1S702_9ROSI|nr:unnamed protein product [Dovyalis caffra]